MLAASYSLVQPMQTMMMATIITMMSKEHCAVYYELVITCENFNDLVRLIDSNCIIGTSITSSTILINILISITIHSSTCLRNISSTELSLKFKTLC